MSTQSTPLHHTVTTRIQNDDQELWEFTCPTCGYRAHYFIPNDDSAPYIKVISVGNPKARHTSNCSQSTSVKSHPSIVEPDSEAWLTPQLRQQMEELLKDVDMGDFGLH